MQVEFTAETMVALQNGSFGPKQQIVEIAVGKLVRSKPNNACLRRLVQAGMNSAQSEPVVTEDQFLQRLAERRLERA